MKKYFGLLLVAVLGLMLFLPVSAASKEGFYADDDVKLTQDIDATTFIAGNTIDVSSKISGINFVAGNEINLKSNQDYLFVAGKDIVIKDASSKDIFAAGSSVNIENTVVRDLYVAAQKVVVNSDIQGTTRIGAEEVDLTGTVRGDLYIDAAEITIGENATVLGTLRYPENAKIKINDTAKIEKKKTYKVDNNSDEVSTTDKIVNGIVSFIKKVCAMIVIAMLLLLVNKGFFKDLDKEEKDVAVLFKRFGMGLLVLLVTPIIGFILLLTGIGAPLSIIVLLLYGILFYLSAIPTSYYLGKWIFNKKIKNEYVLLLVSILLLYVIMAIPYIGGFVSFLSLCIGLGFFISLFYSKAKTKKK